MRGLHTHDAPVPVEDEPTCRGLKQRLDALLGRALLERLHHRGALAHDLMDEGQVGVAEARGGIGLELHAQVLEPVDGLAAVLCVEAAHLGVACRVAG